MFGLGKLWVKKVFRKYTFKKYTFRKYTSGKYTFGKYTFGDADRLEIRKCDGRTDGLTWVGARDACASKNQI